MTFKGATYSSILDLEVLMITWEANLNALKAEYKCYQAMRDLKSLQETQVKINIYEKGMKELQSLEESLLEKIDALNTEVNDIQNQVFCMKFIKGYDNDKIMEELHISQTTLYYYYNKIESVLETTSYGKEVKEELQE